MSSQRASALERGQCLKTARRRQGLTQQEFADKMGVTRSAVAQWETGRASFDVRARDIAAIIGFFSTDPRKPPISVVSALADASVTLHPRNLVIAFLARVDPTTTAAEILAQLYLAT